MSNPSEETLTSRGVSLPECLCDIVDLDSGAYVFMNDTASRMVGTKNMGISCIVGWGGVYRNIAFMGRLSILSNVIQICENAVNNML